MGALVALLPAIAGGAAGTVGTVMSGLGAATSVISGLSAMAQGNRQAEASKLQARQIELQGRMDAVQVNEELMKTLSMNTVATAASGLKSAGTAEYAQQASMQKANDELRIQQMDTSIRRGEALANARAQKTQGLFGFAEGVLSAGDRIGSSLSTKKKTAG
jgi:hypothetical protein